MPNIYKTRAVVRDPGTVFLCWDASNPESSDSSFMLITQNISSGEENGFTVNFKTGSCYIHSLHPDTYYSIIMYKHKKDSKELEKAIDFGTIHTFAANISNSADTNTDWQTDQESLLRLTGIEWEGIPSSDEYYNE